MAIALTRVATNRSGVFIMANLVVRLWTTSLVASLSRILLIGAFLSVQCFLLIVVLLATGLYLGISVGHAHVSSRVVAIVPYLLPGRNRLRLKLTGDYRFLALVINLWLVIAVLSLASVHYARTSSTPGPASAMGLARCDTSPCFNGSIPSRTRWTPELATNTDGNADYHFSVSLRDDGLLQTIEFAFPESMKVVVGDLVKLYGSPCRVAIHLLQQPRTLVLHYPGLQARIKLDSDRLSPDAPVHYLIMLSNQSSVSTPLQAQPCTRHHLDSTGATVWRPWLGFTSLRHYLNAPFPELRQENDEKSDTFPPLATRPWHHRLR